MAEMDQETTADTAHADVDSKPVSPPSILVWLIAGIFLLTVFGATGSVIVFRNVLRPGQQQRVVNMLPFMEAFLSRNPGAGAALPTAIPTYSSGLSSDDLLNIVLVSPTPEIIPTITVQPPTLTSLAVATSTATPTLEPTNTLTSTSTTEVPILPSATPNALPPTANLYGFTYTRQTWNNCGPATITMGLSYFGWREDQDFAASFLKPDEEDKNVTPQEMVSFVNEQSGVRAITRMGGTLDLLKMLIANGYPVILSIGFMPEGYDWLGHYRAIVGYDDYRGVFYAYDSFLGNGDNGEGIVLSFDELDQDWRQFNRNFIVLYRQEEESTLSQLLGEQADPERSAELALEIARQEARVNPQDGFAWFNIGTSLVALERYDEASLAYDQSRHFNLPWRMMWYQFGPYTAYFNVERHDDVLALTTANLNNGGQYVEETHYWQGRAYVAQGNIDEAIRAFNAALSINPRFSAAQEALTEITGG